MARVFSDAGLTRRDVPARLAGESQESLQSHGKELCRAQLGGAKCCSPAAALSRDRLELPQLVCRNAIPVRFNNGVGAYRCEVKVSESPQRRCWLGRS